MSRLRSRAFLLLAFVVSGGMSAIAAPPSVLLITLDTTRADSIGAYGRQSDHRASTPHLDALAARGVRYSRALSPAPLTLPAHASLLTGLDPPAHGIRGNGIAALPSSIPTLATILRTRGYQTAAFVASRVLDHRFGLGRGFDIYDDGAPAEQIGEYGYPERDAEQVTNAALAWAASAKTPFLLWVHYYDPHAPYRPPAAFLGSSEERSYAGEISFVDSQIGRLIAALPLRPDDVIAAVGDHGESLGEHGETTHGIFVYRSTLEVPLIIVGGGMNGPRVVEERVSIVRLPRTLLALAGRKQPRGMAAVLPGLGLAGANATTVYAESYMPASAYGWSPLKSISDQRWHAIVAPRSELYDLEADPDERQNVIDTHRREFFRLRKLLDAYEKTIRAPAVSAVADSELAAAIRSLGYQASAARPGSLDPKDGLRLLAEARRAGALQRDGKLSEAVAILTKLVRANPTNVPFLTDLADAQLESGSTEAALASYRQAVAANPRLDFLHVNLADALRQSGRNDEAIAEYRLALTLNPRLAAAAIRLAEIAEAKGDARPAVAELRRAVNAGTNSASIFTRLARLEMNAGDLPSAERDTREAIRIAQLWGPAWLVLGEIEERKGDDAAARHAYETATKIDPRSPAAALRLAKLARRRGDETTARRLLQMIVAVAPQSPESAEARRLLDVISH